MEVKNHSWCRPPWNVTTIPGIYLVKAFRMGPKQLSDETFYCGNANGTSLKQLSDEVVVLWNLT